MRRFVEKLLTLFWTYCCVGKSTACIVYFAQVFSKGNSPRADVCAQILIDKVFVYQTPPKCICRWFGSLYMVQEMSRTRRTGNPRVKITLWWNPCFSVRREGRVQRSQVQHSEIWGFRPGQAERVSQEDNMWVRGVKGQGPLLPCKRRAFEATPTLSSQHHRHGKSSRLCVFGSVQRARS